MAMKQTILLWLRKIGCIKWVDWAYFTSLRLKYWRQNAAFLNKNVGFALPPAYMMYESYRMDYQAYFEDGKNAAQEIIGRLAPFVSFVNASVLEWGCGPARILRHLPDILPHTKLFGADYNPATIAWCSANINGVNFSVNGLHPPLPFTNKSMDAVYAISVFTHLSEENHLQWIKELHRVMKCGGIFLFTTQGAAFKEKLTKTELHRFNKNQMVFRGHTKEGHRSFSGFHPEAFVRNLLDGYFTVLSFTAGQKQDWGAEQDTWVVKKSD